jgi:hypothetical protein
VRFLKRHVAEGGLERLDHAKSVERLDRAIAAYPSKFVPEHAPNWERHFPFYFFMKKLALMSLGFETNHQKQKRKHQKGPKQKKPDADESQQRAPTLVDVAGKPQELPGGLQSPGMDIDSADWDPAVLVFERSLAYLRALLPETPVIVVYIPSPLSSYRLISPVVSFQNSKIGAHNEQISQNSDRMCQLIRAATISQGAGFLDIRPVIRAGTEHDVLHGPRDFKHFNRKGYEILGKAVAERLDSPLSTPPCMELSPTSTETNAHPALPGGP